MSLANIDLVSKCNITDDSPFAQKECNTIDIVAGPGNAAHKLEKLSWIHIIRQLDSTPSNVMAYSQQIDFEEPLLRHCDEARS